MSDHPHNLLIEHTIPATTAAPALADRAGTEIALRARPSGLQRQTAEGVPPRIEITLDAPKAKPRRLRKLLLIGASVLALSGATYLGSEYWTVWRFQVSTDDAYVKADNTTIAPKVSGYIGDVLVGDNEQVKAGQVLAKIDDRDFRVVLDQAKADVEAAKAAVATKRALLTAQQSIIDAARAPIALDQANLVFAEQDDKRY